MVVAHICCKASSDACHTTVILDVAHRDATAHDIITTPRGTEAISANCSAYMLVNKGTLTIHALTQHSTS